tara:strand:+ start:2472 stop:2978 length:507 start_codon:yes stop_codon:yes gene_type:complete
MIKISFVGPESSGKTTLAETLSKKLNCTLVSEYARKYLKDKSDYSVHDLKKIAVGQSKEFYKKLKRRKNFLVSDTCLIDIEIWSEVKFKTLDPEIKKISDNENFDIYFLCRPDIPWEEDHLRENPNERDFLYDKFKEKLSNRKKKYYVVYGRLDNRLAFCLDIISRNK